MDQITLVSDEKELEQLQPAWELLYGKIAEAHYSDGFDWNWQSWKHVASVRGRELRCIVGHKGGEIVLIWPLALYHDGPWRVARQLGPETSQYSAIITADDAGVIERAEQAWNFMLSNVDCDVVSLPSVREGSPTDRFFRSGHCGWSSRVVLLSYWLSRDDTSDWNEYQKSRSSGKRKDLARLRRRCSETGELVFEARLKGTEYQEAISWLLNQKRDWLSRTGERNEWLSTPEYEKFLRAFVTSSTQDGMLLSTLKHDGRLIAATLGCVGRSSVECLVHTYDPDYSKFSPGLLLIEDVVKWSIDHGLGFDLRIGNEGYKSYFCGHQGNTIHYRFACTNFGKLYVARHAMMHAIRSFRGWASSRVPRRMRRDLRRNAPFRPVLNK